MKAPGLAGPRAVPAAALRVVSSPGRPLEPAARSSMEARFGHDFSRIRVHDDGEAADSAHAVHASAYSIGPHLVFGRQRYAPGTSGGDALLAHELAHAVQHDRHPGAGGPGVSAPSAPDEREAARAADRVAQGAPAGPLMAAPSAALHREEEEIAPLTGDLMQYLRKIRRSGRIEGDNDSDDKAVRIVRLWSAGRFERLEGKDKAILIWELLDGPTTGPDEQAIVELLERSDNDHLDKIFRFYGEQIQKQITEDVPDDEGSQLADFCRRRWMGGIEAFRKGSGWPRPSGVPVPIGKPLPTPRPGPIEEIKALPKPQAPDWKGLSENRAEMPELPQAPAVEPGDVYRQQPPAWTPVPEPPDVESPQVTAGPFGPRAPYPATGFDFLKGFLATEKGTEVKDQTLRLIEKMVDRVTPAEAVAILINVAATAGIFFGSLGLMSEQQRLQIWNLITSDRDVDLLRPMDQKTFGPPAVEF